jgi:hypothetical protein
MGYIKFLDVEESVFMRDIGFNDECFKRLPLDKNLTKDIISITLIKNSDIKNMKQEKMFVSCPTREQAFAFFRDVYSLYYTPLEVNEDSKYDGFFYFELWYSQIEGTLFTEYHKKYEDAEKEALNKLIKLIYVNNFGDE